MKKENRIAKKEDFESIFKRGRFVRGTFISLKAKKTSFGYVRLGILAGKKVSKKAVVRNKIKRQLRGAMREYILDSKASIDVVVMPMPEIVNKSFKEIKEEVAKLFKKAGISSQIQN